MLEKEFKFFTENLDKIFRLYPNKYIVIKDEDVKYISDSRDEALSFAIKHFKLGTFLIQPCLKSAVSPIQNISIKGTSFLEKGIPFFSLVAINNNGIASRIVSPVTLIDTFTGKTLKTTAIWDTGAENCHIDRIIAKRLGLIAIQKAISSGFHGTKEVNAYSLKIALSDEPVLLSSFALEYEENLNGSGFIIGMNIIRLGDFLVTNHEGRTMMSFKIPLI